jgi:hypothetical protein
MAAVVPQFLVAQLVAAKLKKAYRKGEASGGCSSHSKLDVRKIFLFRAQMFAA